MLHSYGYSSLTPVFIIFDAVPETPVESVDGAELNDAPEAANQLEVAARQAGMVMFGNAAREGFFSDFKRVSQTHHDVLIDGVSPLPHTCFTHFANASPPPIASFRRMRLSPVAPKLTSASLALQKVCNPTHCVPHSGCRRGF